MISLKIIEGQRPTSNAFKVLAEIVLTMDVVSVEVLKEYKRRKEEE